LTADRIIKWIGDRRVGRYLAGGGLGEGLQRARVLIDVAGIGGHDLPERAPRLVEVDLQDRVGVGTLLVLARGVAGAPVQVLAARVVRRRAPQPSAGVAGRLIGGRDRRGGLDHGAGGGVDQREPAARRRVALRR